ncbi:hypothetical protein SASPL_139909 [Salvia splendens]|uniref:Uncharacterized protein n=1 Tax=Salvia splendens TaxID=180675 RepID=A0A8X8WPU1_SALSN|nr:hypothetical protein SASPL_139909 [Salvia splendens]
MRCNSGGSNGVREIARLKQSSFNCFQEPADYATQLAAAAQPTAAADQIAITINYAVNVYLETAARSPREAVRPSGAHGDSRGSYHHHRRLPGSRGLRSEVGRKLKLRKS